MELEIKRTHPKYEEQAIKLVFHQYKELKSDLPFLSDIDDFKNDINKNINDIFKNGFGVTAIYKDKLVGFLIGYEVKELFGRDKGIYIPSYGHAALKKDAKVIYQKMYTQAAKGWVEQNCLNHAITILTCDRDVINSFFRLGFGLRCMDAIKEVKEIKNISDNSKLNIKKATLTDIEKMKDLYKENCLYYKKSPLFMPVSNNISIEELKDWFNKINHHLWVVYKDNKIIGFMRIEPTGETIISKHPAMMNITGAYIDQEYRRQNIGEQLLIHVMDWLKNKEYKLCGVDFESINITGSNFWLKHFTPYTNSLVRHIDDRINN